MAITANKKFWTEFIDIYHSLPCLWNAKDENYNSRESRSRARNKLVQKLREVEPDANQDAVKRKINTFRSNFNREVRKMRQTQKAQTTEKYNPTLWYFEHLSFLLHQVKCNGNGMPMDDDHYEEDITMMAMMSTTKSEKAEEIGTMKTESVNQDDVDNEPNPLYESFLSNNLTMAVSAAKCDSQENLANAVQIAPSCSTTDMPKPAETLETSLLSERRKLHTSHSRRSRLRAQPYSVKNKTFPSNSTDEASIYGQSWACSYRKLSHQQKLYAKKAIEEILILGQLKALKLNSVPVNANLLEEPSDGE